MWCAALVWVSLAAAPIQEAELDREHRLFARARWGPASVVDQNNRVAERSYVVDLELTAPGGPGAPGEVGAGFAPLAIGGVELERVRLKGGSQLVAMTGFTNPVVVAPAAEDPYRDAEASVPADRWRIVALHHMPTGTERVVEKVKGRIEVLSGGSDRILTLNDRREDGVFRPLRDGQLSRERITAELAVERQSRLVVEVRGNLERLTEVRGTSRDLELQPLDTRQRPLPDGGLRLEWDLEGDWPAALGLEFEVLSPAGQGKTVRLELPRELTYNAQELVSERLADYGLEASVRGQHPKVYRVRGLAPEPRLVRGLSARLTGASDAPALEVNSGVWEDGRFEVWARLNPEAPLGTRPVLIWRVGARWNWERFEVGPLNDPGEPELWGPAAQR
jgi:hypothetical protein